MDTCLFGWMLVIRHGVLSDLNTVVFNILMTDLDDY